MSHNLDLFNLEVKDYTGKSYKIHCVGLDHTIEYIKFALEQELGIDRQRINLIHKSVNLLNHSTLHECGIEKTTKLTSVITLQTGR